MAHALPETVAGVGRYLPAERVRVELGIEQSLKIIQVVLTVLMIAQQVLYQRYTGDRALPVVMPGVARPVENVGVLPFRREIVDTQAVVVVPRDEREVRGAH